MRNPFAWFYNAVRGWVASGDARRDIEEAITIARQALPVIARVADVATGLTPSTADDIIWKTIREKYPQFFNRSLATDEEFKRYAAGVAAELLRAQFPTASQNVLMLATELAYTDWKGLGKPPSEKL